MGAFTAGLLCRLDVLVVILPEAVDHMRQWPTGATGRGFAPPDGTICLLMDCYVRTYGWLCGGCVMVVCGWPIVQICDGNGREIC